MSLYSPGFVVAADAVETAITHLQAHSATDGGNGTTNAVGSRVAVTGKTASNNTVTVTGSFTGLPANQTIARVTYWTASTGGTCLGGGTPTGDTAANAAGAYTATVTETFA